MLTAILLVCIFLHYGGSQLPQEGTRRVTPLNNNSSLNLILGDQCVTREEVQAIVERINTEKAQAIVSDIRDEVQALIRTEVQSLTRHVAEIQSHTAALTQTLLPGSFNNPATTCRNIQSEGPSGYYWIQTNTGSPTRQYCDMTRTSCCNTTGGWMRVANLDMTDPNQQCPSGFRLVTSPRRTCGRPGPIGGCVSTTFSVHGFEYSQVCGKVKAYQFGHTDGFNIGSDDIDSYYVEGVSLTHGSPRQHIWTFVGALHEHKVFAANVCQCTRTDVTFTGSIPSFVGNDYFCETGSRNRYQNGHFYHEDPLWDGQGCGAISTCCTFNNPPWFCKTLPQPTSDDIELRICASLNPSQEDTPIESVEIYVQ